MNLQREILTKRVKLLSSGYIDYKDFTQLFEYLNNPLLSFDFDEPKVYKDKNYIFISNYMFGEYKRLYQVISADVKQFEKPIRKNSNTLIIVHPYYPLLRHCNYLSRDVNYYTEFLLYETRINNLIKSFKGNLILFDTPDSVAIYSKNYLINSYVNRVVFTNHSHGKPLHNEKIDLQDINNVFICGCYLDNCINEVRNYVCSINRTANVRIMRDYSLNRYCN